MKSFHLVDPEVVVPAHFSLAVSLSTVAYKLTTPNTNIFSSFYLDQGALIIKLLAMPRGFQNVVKRAARIWVERGHLPYDWEKRTS